MKKKKRKKAQHSKHTGCSFYGKTDSYVAMDIMTMILVQQHCLTHGVFVWCWCLVTEGCFLHEVLAMKLSHFLHGNTEELTRNL